MRVKPILGKKMSRPRKLFDKRGAVVIDDAYAFCIFEARMLDLVVRKALKIHISHNRIRV